MMHCGEFPFILTEYLNAGSCLELTRVCSGLYLAIPRNTALGISIWRRYLDDERYVTNRLLFDFGKDVTDMDRSNCSRANYKCILASVSGRSGLLRVQRLRKLLVEGKLSIPVLPRKGGWRCLARLDQFALKRLAGEDGKEDRLVPPSENGMAVNYLVRILLRGRVDLVKDKIAKLDELNLIKVVTELFQHRAVDGLLGILEISVDKNEEFFQRIGEIRSNLNNYLIHLISPNCTNLQIFTKLRHSINHQNLLGDSPLHLVRDPAVYDHLLSLGADRTLLNRKGIRPTRP
jgi:hypothetical protein